MDKKEILKALDALKGVVRKAIIDEAVAKKPEAAILEKLDEILTAIKAQPQGVIFVQQPCTLPHYPHYCPLPHAPSWPVYPQITWQIPSVVISGGLPANGGEGTWSMKLGGSSGIGIFTNTCLNGTTVTDAKTPFTFTCREDGVDATGIALRLTDGRAQ